MWVYQCLAKRKSVLRASGAWPVREQWLRLVKGKPLKARSMVRPSPGYSKVTRMEGLGPPRGWPVGVSGLGPPGPEAEAWASPRHGQKEHVGWSQSRQYNNMCADVARRGVRNSRKTTHQNGQRRAPSIISIPKCSSPQKHTILQSQ